MLLCSCYGIGWLQKAITTMKKNNEIEIAVETKIDGLFKLFNANDKRQRTYADASMRIGAFMIACMIEETSQTVDEATSTVKDRLEQSREDLTPSQRKSMLDNAVALLPFAISLHRNLVSEDVPTTWDNARKANWPSRQYALNIAHAAGKSPQSILSVWEPTEKSSLEAAKKAAFMKLSESPHFDAATFGDQHVEAGLQRLAKDNRPKANRDANPTDGQNAFERLASLRPEALDQLVRDTSHELRRKVVESINRIRLEEQAAVEASKTESL